jgi:hypothetical protein
VIPLELVPRVDRRPGVISILCPSRRRPVKLTDSIASLRDTATRPDLIEVLVAYDPDDPETRTTADVIGADVIWESPERYGHAGCAHYYAALLDRCHGEWMNPWNDDAFMKTEGWDDIVRAHPPSVLYVNGNAGDCNCFPFVHLDLFHTLGRFTDHPAIDTWYDEVGLQAACWWRTPIYVFQDRPDLSPCEPDETYLEGREGSRSAEFFRSPYTELRAEDVDTLLEARCAA